MMVRRSLYTAMMLLLLLSSPAFLLSFADAWTTTTTSTSRIATKSNAATTTSTSGTTTTTRLYNIPPPSSETDPVAFQEYASKQPPPASFFELQKDCLQATKVALADGLQLLEIEFPPLPANVLELDDVSAYDVAQATLKLAVEYAKGVVAQDLCKNGKVAIMLPDESEAKISIENYMGTTSSLSSSEGNVDSIPSTIEVSQGVTISSLRRSEEGDDRLIKVCASYRTRTKTFLLLHWGGRCKVSVCVCVLCAVASKKEKKKIKSSLLPLNLLFQTQNNNNNNNNQQFYCLTARTNVLESVGWAREW